MNGPARGTGNLDTLTLAKPIAKCGVLYLGSAVPRPDVVGIDSVQEPLSKRYPVDSTNSVYGIDSVLIVRENGVELSFNQDPSISLFYPIEALVYCASVRFASVYGHTDSKSYNVNQPWPFKLNWGFAPLDSPFASTRENQHHPPLFCAIFKRTRNVAADECHCFITKTKESAMILVHACFTAFNKEQQRFPSKFYNSWFNSKKIPIYIKSVSSSGRNDNSSSGQVCYEVDHGHVRVIEAPTAKPIVDFMTNPNGDGFFYTSGHVSIDTWQLWEERQGDKNPEQQDGGRRNYGQKLTAMTAEEYRADVMANPSTNGDSNEPEEQQESDSNDDAGNSSFESSTEYYHGISSKYTLPREIAENISHTTKYGKVDPYEPAPNLVKVEHKRDPVTGANIFVRWFRPEGACDRGDDHLTQEARSPVRAVQKMPPAPQVSRYVTSSEDKDSKPVVIIREMAVVEDQSEGGDNKQKERSKLKSILRKTKRSHEKSKVNVAGEGLFDQQAYQITEAYFEDKSGKVHRVLNKLDDGRHNHLRYKLLDDSHDEDAEYRSPVSDKSVVNSLHRASRSSMSVGLPIGAKVPSTPSKSVHARQSGRHNAMQRRHMQRDEPRTRRRHSVQELSGGARQHTSRGMRASRHSRTSRRQHKMAAGAYSEVLTGKYPPLIGYQQMNNLYSAPQFQNGSLQQQFYAGNKENMFARQPHNQQFVWGFTPLSNGRSLCQNQVYPLM